MTFNNQNYRYVWDVSTCCHANSKNPSFHMENAWTWWLYPHLASSHSPHSPRIRFSPSPSSTTSVSSHLPVDSCSVACWWRLHGWVCGRRRPRTQQPRLVTMMPVTMARRPWTDYGTLNRPHPTISTNQRPWWPQHRLRPSSAYLQWLLRQ